MRKHTWVIVPVCAAVGIAATASVVEATPQSGVTTKTLATAVLGQLNLHGHTVPADRWGVDLQTRGLSDAYVVNNVLAPQATTGWHSHSGPSLVFVVRGTVTNFASDAPGCAGAQYAAGQVFVDEGGEHAHMLLNTSVTDTAETIAVQLVPHGDTRRLDRPVPAGC